MAIAKFGQVRISALNNTLASLPGMKFVMNSGSSTTWTDAVGGVNMTLTGGVTHNGDYATFDGTDDYATTGGVSAPSWASGFAGLIADQASYNGSGVSVFLLFRTTDIAGRTICQWENSGDNTKWLTRVTSAGLVEFWNCYATDTGAQLTAPPSDRYNRIPRDIRPYVNDGQWHLLQFSRSTGLTGWYEKKVLYIDGVQGFFGGTGNVVNGFTDWDVPITFGKATDTSIIVEDTFSNFKGDVALFAVRNRWTYPAEMLANWKACASTVSRRGRGRSFGN